MSPFPTLKLKPKAANPVIKAVVVARPSPAVTPSDKALSKQGKSPKVPKRAKIKQPAMTPEEIAAARLQAQTKTRAVLSEMMSRWPLLFPETGADLRYPWAIGLRQKIHQVLADAGISTSKACVSRAFQLYLLTRHQDYQALLANGGPRYNLDLQPEGEITAKQIERAGKRAQAKTGDDHE